MASKGEGGVVHDREREESPCMRELQRECISAGYTGEPGNITPEQHPYERTAALS